MGNESYKFMSYTVKQLASLANVSVRTIHYYDDIDLLKPSRVSSNGYRHYEDEELIRLRHILFFKELDFSLEEIKNILDNPSFDTIEALRDQKHLLTLKRKRLDRLITNINKTIQSMQNNEPLVRDDMYNPLKDDDIKQYQDEVKKRWGNTDAYKQSIRRVKQMTKEEMETFKADGKKLTREIANNMYKGVEHPDVQKLIAKHYESINTLYDCSLEMYRNLGAMYADDTRFGAYYEQFRKGLAAFMRDAIAYYCERNK